MTAPADPAAPSTTVLFDLDGTITDSFDGIAASFRHALTTIGHPTPDASVVAGIAGPPMQDTFRTLGLDDAAIDAAMTAYRARYTDVGWQENAVFPGMADLVRDLRASGRRTAVSTSKNETTARRILDHFGLGDCFEFIAGASDDGTRRTKSDVVAHALAGLGIDATHPDGVTDVVIVGDRSHDVHGAGEFGIPAVFVEWGYSLPGEVDDARWSVRTVDDLRTVLGLSPAADRAREEAPA
ncbi:HAD hydrolase-like protein [Williamsia sp. SKLECPSW1]